MPPSICRRCAALAAALSLAITGTAGAQQKFSLGLRPTPGEVIRYHDHYELWITAGQQSSNRPNVVVDLWRSERADVHGDTVIFDALTDSARASAPLGGAPPEFPRAAELMRGAHVIDRYTSKGRQIGHLERGPQVADLFNVLLGRSKDAEREYRSWSALPEDSVAEGGTWSDSVNQRTSSNEWRGRMDYRLRRVETRGGGAVGRIQVEGTLRAASGDMNPERYRSTTDVDIASGRVIRSETNQEDGYQTYNDFAEITVTFRSIWKTERVRT